MENAFDKLTSFLTGLEHGGISYTLAHNRDEAITVSVAVPGERWEIEFVTMVRQRSSDSLVMGKCTVREF